MERMRVEKAVEPYLLDASTHAAFLSSILTGHSPPRLFVPSKNRLHKKQAFKRKP
jgi:hypothetical protein